MNTPSSPQSWDGSQPGNAMVFAADRLALQARSTHQIDMVVLRPILETLRTRFQGDTLRILDVGCAHGDLAHQRFADQPAIDVTGIEIHGAFVGHATQRFGSDRFHFQQADAQTYRPPRKQHLILMMQLLQHVPDPYALSGHYWNHLEPGGFIVARNSDDQLNITYPSDAALQLLIDRVNALPAMPDRLFGRKLFGLMNKLSPAPQAVNVSLMPQLVQGGSAEERGQFFDEMHSFRPLYADRVAKDHPTPENRRCADEMKAIAAAERERFVNDPTLFAAEIQFIVSAERRLDWP